MLVWRKMRNFADGLRVEALRAARADKSDYSYIQYFNVKKHSMKKIFTLLAVALVALVAQAKTCDVVIHIDDPTHAEKVTFGSKTYTFDENGDIKFTASTGDGMRIYTADPWVLDKGLQVYNEETYYDLDCGAASEYYCYVDCDYATTARLEFTTAKPEELMKNSCTVYVTGDASKMCLLIQGVYTREVEGLHEGANIVKFLDSENYMVVSSVDMYHPLYQVYQNSTQIEKAHDVWSMDLKDGDFVDVTVSYPYKEIKINIDYQGDASPKSVKFFQMGGVTYEEPAATVTGLMGELMTISFNNINYEVNSFKVNGVEVEGTEMNVGYECVLEEDINFVIDQTKKPVYTANVTVDDCTRIKYNEAGTERSPKSNTFVVEMAQDMIDLMPIYFYPAEVEYEIKTCTADGVPAQYSTVVNGYYVAMEENVQEIVITTGPIERNDSFVFYFDNPEATYDADLGFKGWWMECDLAKRDVKDEVEQGYNEIPFASIDGQFRFGILGEIETSKANTHVYVNNKALAMFEAGALWYITPKNADVMKVYMGAEAPEFQDVVFSVTDETAVQYAKADVMRNISVSDGLKLSELPRTAFEMAIAPGFQVRLNGDIVSPAEGSLYKFSVEGPLKVRIEEEGSGIDTITADSAADSAVYTLMGVKVSNGAIDALPAGIYVQQGRKVYVK